MKKLIKDDKGVTLIALIITIIILVILAAVSISSISKSGVVEYAKKRNTRISNTRRRRKNYDGRCWGKN